jgi:thiamine kinase-like enzyme
VQYLKEESLFECLEMGVIFIDERVLADSYDKYDRKIYYSDKVEKVVQGERVELPPMKLRKEISKELQQEVNEMSEKELLANMKEIKKEKLDYKGIRKENSSYNCWIYSKKLLKEKYTTSYKNKPELRKEYDKVKDIILGKNLEYIYIN